MLHNHPASAPTARLRAQVQDLLSENIATLATEAGPIEGMIPLWYGEGDLPTPDFVRDAAKRTLDAGRTFYVPDMRGNAELVAALSAYQTRLYQQPIGTDRSTVTPGGMQGILLALELICDLGSNVVYIEPQWPNSHNCIHLVGGEPRPVPMGYDVEGWRLDLDRVFARCDARTRAILFSSPANPTGWTATRAELQALLDFSRERGIWIIADEVYARLFWDADAAPSMLEIAGPEDLVMVVQSFSKAWAMTGFRVGWITHPASICARVSAVTQYMNSGTADFIQTAAATALEDGEPFVRMMRDRCHAGLRLAYDRLGANPLFKLPPMPRGGMYAFFEVQGWEDSRAACVQALRRAQVGLAPGALFGNASGHLRMCIARDPAQLGTALDRLVALA